MWASSPQVSFTDCIQSLSLFAVNLCHSLQQVSIPGSYDTLSTAPTPGLPLSTCMILCCGYTIACTTFLPLLVWAMPGIREEMSAVLNHLVQSAGLQRPFKPVLGGTHRVSSWYWFSCGTSAMYWARKWAHSWLSACTTHCCPSSSTALLSFYKMAPYVALMGVWAWNLFCSCTCLHEPSHSASAHGWIKKISRTCSFMSRFTSWAPLGCWWNCNHWAPSGCGISGFAPVHCLFAASPYPWVCRWPSTSKETIDKMKRQSMDWEKNVHTLYLIRD